MRNNSTAWATLRKDGYVSLDAYDKPGQLLTKPLHFAGKALTVNLAAPQGALRVELQDESSRPLNDFRMSDCIWLSGDGQKLPVRWRGDGDLRRIADRPVRVRLELENGSLYSFRFV
jgi:hypothetical protein